MTNDQQELTDEVYLIRLILALRYNEWFYGTCDTFILIFTKSFETFRAYAIIISQTFLPLDKNYSPSYRRALFQIPNILRNDSLKYVLYYFML